jgi:GNAT superfamily N-acetyltransferase
MLSINQIKDPKQIAATQELMREYLTWFFALVPGSESAPTFQGWEAEIANLPDIYVPPMGRLLLATYDEQPAGCIALKQVTDQIGELKRMYVRSRFRGNRIGWHLGKALLDEALAIGYKRVVLDSHISMNHAHKIYEELGFKRVTAPPEFPQELIPIVVFMEYDL